MSVHWSDENSRTVLPRTYFHDRFSRSVGRVRLARVVGRHGLGGVGAGGGWVSLHLYFLRPQPTIATHPCQELRNVRSVPGIGGGQHFPECKAQLWGEVAGEESDADAGGQPIPGACMCPASPDRGPGGHRRRVPRSRRSRRPAHRRSRTCRARGRLRRSPRRCPPGSPRCHSNSPRRRSVVRSRGGHRRGPRRSRGREGSPPLRD